MVTAGFQTNQVKKVQVSAGAVRTGQVRTVQVRTYTWNSSVALLSPTCLNQVYQFWKHRASQGQLRALRVTYGHIMAQFGYLEVTLLRLKVIVFQATMNMICLFQE